jgi:hypothetical protein
VHLGPTHISSLTLSIELCLRYVNKRAESTRGIHLRVICPDKDFLGHVALDAYGALDVPSAGINLAVGEFGGRGEESTPLYSANGPAMDTLALQLHHPR